MWMSSPSPLKLVLRTYFSSVFPSMDSIRGQTPGWSGHRSLCMLCSAWAMAYTASITNCTFPSCSYLESIPMRSWPEGRDGEKRGLGAKCIINRQRLGRLGPAHHLRGSILFRMFWFFWRKWSETVADSLLYKYIQAEILWQRSKLRPSPEGCRDSEWLSPEHRPSVFYWHTLQ